MRRSGSHVRSMEKRMNVVLFFFFVFAAILLGRLFSFQVLAGAEYRAYAEQQYSVSVDLPVPRGTIFFREKDGALIPFASMRPYKNLILAPNRVTDPGEVIRVLAAEFSVPEGRSRALLAKTNDPYEIVAKKIAPSEAAERVVASVDGLFFEDAPARVYPFDSLGARLVGFVGPGEKRDEGKYGIERMLDDDLAGEGGIFSRVTDARGFFVALGKTVFQEPARGRDAVLTIDYNIERRAREVLSRVVEKWNASMGIVIVIEPATGKIIALDALPAFDPNAYNKERDLSVFLNPAVESVYELGSVMKPVTMAAGIEEKKVSPQTTYVDEGLVRVKDREIRNFDGKARGVQTMTQVLEKSLNTGAVYIARLLGHQTQLSYIRRFGFDEKTGVGLPGEIGGDLSNLLRGGEVEYATASFGQGIAVTPLQMAMAIAAIANNGVLMRPYVVEEIRSGENVIFRNEPAARGPVVSPETSQAVTKMLVSVVRNGFEKRASVAGYFIAGKTGTAQIPRKDGKGYSDDSIHTLVGYAPAFKPRFLVYLQINEPKGNRFAANTLTPAFYDLAEYILNYYEVPPDEK